ncbi:MAG: universal stress protein [Pseudomonadota bacterium]|jgi:universal stress protein A|nr:MAG: universal stress protein [Pseudomonadota bacterium]
MDLYRNILAVVDLSPDGIHVAQRARALASLFPGATLKLLHVVEYVPVEPLSDSLLPAVQIEGELVERARSQMAKLAGQLDPEPQWEVAIGSIKGEIVRAARTGGHDLIVIGSHERHGLSILINLIEDAVLHAAPCDVLAVRLPAAERTA